ncbi:enterotoxin A family protein [Luteibacter sp. PPL201]|uniref:Enterotoxin A family protein n=1 Tax=Luteibacter sahnii TaxID=3021977 RepID=A0ABT6B9E6_9GAMM|nr:enterotoxin A family protein [Luteibacter sp. PPL193]MDY1546693.1 enterotoxin A family protein [Luteibacter sp. PPL193]
MAPRFVLVLLFALASSASHASFFYRMDTRPPEEIFQHGFAPSGRHPSVFQHVVGQTCQPGARTTGFVAVSANESFAIAWGRENQPEGSTFYVYRIRSSEHFYNAAQSLFYARRQTNEMAYEMAGWIFLAEAEWITPRPIPPVDVVEAAQYVSRGRHAAPGRVATYIPAGVNATPGPLNHSPFVWDYGIDTQDAPPAFNPLCPAVCFGTDTLARQRRGASTWYDVPDDAVDDARRKADRILDCVGRTASAALGIDLFPAPSSPPPKTEL